MMTADPLVALRLEAGNRLVAQRPWSGPPHPRPVLLLQQTGTLPGTARLAQVGGATVVIADTYLCDEDRSVPLAERRLRRQLAGTHAEGHVPEAEVVAALLTEQGARYEPCDDFWSVTSLRGEPASLSVRPIAGGVRVEAALVELARDADLIVVEALSEFLLAAQAALRFARVELTPRGFLISGACDTARMDEHLGPALAAVAHGVKRLVAEATALTDPELAAQYVHWIQATAAREEP